MPDTPPRVRILSLAVHERPWVLRIPFHYGVTVLHQAAEIHVVCEIEVDGKDRSTGFAAEIAAPKWFEKSPDLSPEDTVNRLRRAVALVAERAANLSSSALPLGRLSRLLADVVPAPTLHVNLLELSFAKGLIERAVIDALCRVIGRSFLHALRIDAFGLADIWPHEGRLRLGTWLGNLLPTRSLAVRHTVGLKDALTASDLTERISGRPVALEAVIALDGVRHFKIKLGRSPDDLARLEAIAGLLDRDCRKYAVTLDANEAFTDPAEFVDLCRRMAQTSSMTKFWDAVRYIEQPFDRSVALAQSIRGLPIDKAIIIDESDCEDLSFEQALALGYRGVSIKTCKGAIRGILNAARSVALSQGTDMFVTAEDLCVQPGIGLQQNIALAASLGLSNAERNGHHFGPGPSALPPQELSALIDRHADVYAPDRLIIREGSLSTDTTLSAVGFGTAILPAFADKDAELELAPN